MEQAIAPVVRHEQIVVAVVVVVADAGALAPSPLIAQACRAGDVLESAVAAVPVQVRPRLLALRKALERRAVDQEDVEPAVGVVVDQRDAGSGGLEQIPVRGLPSEGRGTGQAGIGAERAKREAGIAGRITTHDLFGPLDRRRLRFGAFQRLPLAAARKRGGLRLGFPLVQPIGGRKRLLGAGQVVLLAQHLADAEVRLGGIGLVLERLAEFGQRLFQPALLLQNRAEHVVRLRVVGLDVDGRAERVMASAGRRVCHSTTPSV